MSSNSRIPIFYACDDRFVKFTIVSLRSMIENASKAHKYSVHILNTGISGDMRDVLLGMQNEEFEISIDDVTEYLTSINDKLPVRDYYSKTTYFRLFIAEMFPEYDKALYIDSDTVVLGDISGLVLTDIGENYVGACNEQAMVQEDVFGTYVEQVLGVDRNHYFNAGVLLINCDKFRKEKVLDQFVELLHTYNFVVTQDEDYLNLICKDKVHWLPQKWNTEMFGNICCTQEEAQIIHYIMVSKPWHYEDCSWKEFFWKYAELTPVCDRIRQTLAEYTDEERKRDQVSCENLIRLALDETSKENNYLNMKKQGKLKAKDRLIVLDKIAKLEREGHFDEDVEEDPPTKELKPEDIDYLRKKFRSKIKTRFAYRMARKFLNTIIENKQLIIKDIVGVEHFRNLNSGAIITCNHFNAFDSFAIQMAYDASGQQQNHRKFFRVIREGNYTNFPGFYGLLMRNCNTFPLSSNITTMKKFMTSMDTVLKQGHLMLIYPEQSMWWNYRKPKPLKKGAYTFAVRNGVPVLPCFITMQDSDILGDDGFYVQEYTIHIAEPIYPDPALTGPQNVEMMRRKNYEIWKKIYEDTYHEPLVYSCDQKAE